MTPRIERLLNAIRNKEHHVYRHVATFEPVEQLAASGLSFQQRVTARLVEFLKAETPVILPEERLVYTRTITNLPDVFTDQEWETIKAEHFVHEWDNVNNICPDHASTIGRGLGAERQRCEQLLSDANEEQAEFLSCVISSIDAVLDLAERYLTEARRIGNDEMAEILSQVPYNGATSFHEALQFLRILHFTLWCEGEYHNTLGRFDQYMYPYLKADLDSGKLDRDGALELVEEFFISLNKDSDLYRGIQQGDNGQSLMLGGVDAEGNDAFNLLSELVLQASRELKLIDPKINLRVSSKTPLRVFESGTLLTREGLGFPQYSNDDIVIQGLVNKGYSLEDARNYTVAACWEFIIPRYGMEIPNIGAINLPKVINDCLLNDLDERMSYDDLFTCVKVRLKEVCRAKAESIHNLYLIPAPFMSLMMGDCLARGQDISLGARYNNFGFHGVGLSTAVDSLAAIKRYVYDEKTVDVATLKDIIANGFEGHESLQVVLRYETPKFGDNDPDVDAVAVAFVETFGHAVEGLTNERGGCFRAGTGSAMYYLWYAQDTGCTFSGHNKGEFFSANYSPELFARNKGPLSVIQSFTKPDLAQVINGGPLTLEFHSTVFRDPDSVRKVALLVKSFVDLGGHQLQLNSVNKEVLLDAQAHPENYRNLIVRVWGWSAYFVELDKAYQDHVIARQEFSF